MAKRNSASAAAGAASFGGTMSPTMSVPSAFSSLRKTPSRRSSSAGLRYCATECSTIRSNEPAGIAAASSGVNTEIFALPA